MHTILVPTDFSATAKNAAVYAVGLAKQVGAKKIVLYNSYQAPVGIDPMVPAIQLLDIDLLKKNSEEGLEQFKSQLKTTVADHIPIDTLSEFNLLAAGLDEVCKKVDADLIVMGITGGGALEENLVGSNTISVAKHSTVPVIIVPANASFAPIKEVLLACDYKKVVETTPVQPIKNLLAATGAKLFVLNVDHNNKAYDSEVPFESLMLDTLLQGCNPEYHFVDSPDFTEAINAFAREKEVDIIITIPKKHGWFENLFRKSHTKMLAFHSDVPLMVIHE
jgi:nucleotide-binding universal stress UspA family protein